MVLVRLFGIAVVGAVLGGCAGAPLEHREPYKVVTVDMPVRQVYENLKAYPYCGAAGWRADDKYDHYASQFSVSYAYGGFFGPAAPSDLISGKAVGESKTELRLISLEKWQTPISQKFLNRLQTGKCDGLSESRRSSGSLRSLRMAISDGVSSKMEPM